MPGGSVPATHDAQQRDNVIGDFRSDRQHQCSFAAGDTRFLPAPLLPRTGLARAFLLEAIARDALGDPAAAGRALERVLDLAEPDGALSLFLLHPAPCLLERQARQRTAHAALIAEIQALLAGNRSAPPLGSQAGWARSGGLDEQLTDRRRDPRRALPADPTHRARDRR